MNNNLGPIPDISKKSRGNWSILRSPYCTIKIGCHMQKWPFFTFLAIKTNFRLFKFWIFWSIFSTFDPYLGTLKCSKCHEILYGYTLVYQQCTIQILWFYSNNKVVWEAPLLATCKFSAGFCHFWVPKSSQICMTFYIHAECMLMYLSANL